MDWKNQCSNPNDYWTGVYVPAITLEKLHLCIDKCGASAADAEERVPR